MRGMLSFYQYKNDNSSQILQTGPLSVTRTYCSCDPDIVKTAPVLFMTVHYHLPVVFIHSPLGVQVQQHLFPERVHPHRRVERIGRRHHIYAANLGTENTETSEEKPNEGK